MKTTRFAVCLVLAAQAAWQLRADGTVPVVAEGRAAAVYLPAVTETEKFVAMDDAKAREIQRARNTMAIRVFKSFDHAGSYDRVFLLADE